MLWSSNSMAICIICISLIEAAIVDDYQVAGDYDYDYEDKDESKAKSERPVLDPVINTSRSTEVPVQQSSDALLNCDVRNDQVNNVFVWYNNTIMISSGNFAMNDRIEILKNNSLRIKNVQSWDAGDYYCVVMPEKIKMHIHLKLSAPLAIYYNSQDVTDQIMTFRQGQQVLLDCRATAKHEIEPIIKWSLNGRRAEQMRMQVIGGRLIVNNIDADHIGIYQCLADFYGSRDPPHGLVMIDVQYVPKVSTHRHHVNTAAGDTFVAQCDYKANPIANVHWLRRGRVLGYSEKYNLKLSNMPDNNRNRSILTVKNVNMDDLGEYICQVQNVIGSSEIRVHVSYVPEIAQFEDIKISGNRVILHWLVRSIQPLSEAVLDYKLSGAYTWSTVSVIHTHRFFNGDHIWKVSHEIELRPGEWHTRVKTRNTVGWSHFSDSHSFILLPDDSTDNLMEEDGFVPQNDWILSAGFGAADKSSNYRSSSGKRSLTWQSLVLCGFLSTVIAYKFID